MVFYQVLHVNTIQNSLRERMHNTVFYLGGDCSTSWWPWAFLRCFSRSERLSRFARRPWRRMALKIRPRPHLSGYFLKQEIFLRFSLPSTRERRSFKNGPWSGDFKKRRLLVYVWTDANGGFRIRWCHTLYTTTIRMDIIVFPSF